jgi:hypothetical protein
MRGGERRGLVERSSFWSRSWTVQRAVGSIESTDPRASPPSAWSRQALSGDPADVLNGILWVLCTLVVVSSGGDLCELGSMHTGRESARVTCVY